MTDHQTSPVGEDTERVLFDAAFSRAKILGRAGMEFAANLCRLGTVTIRGVDYVRRDSIMNEVADWRRAFDSAPEVPVDALRAARRAAPALDASGLPQLPVPAHRGPTGTDAYFDSYTAEQVRQAQRDAVASRHAEIADLRAELAQTESAYRSVIEVCRGAAHALLAARDMVGHPDNVAFIDRALADPEALVKGAAPTQPKAQVGASIDTPEFCNLLGDLLECYRDELRGGPELRYEKARTALIAHIDAWAGSRAGDAVPDGWKLVPSEPTNKMTGIGQDLRYKSVNSIGAIYRAMLAAAPAPGKQAGDDLEGA
jgi:hypothetical protein